MASSPILSASDDPCLAAGRGDVAALTAMFAAKRKTNISVDKQRDQIGFTALHCAVDNKHMDATVFLLNAGADCNIQNKAGLTPLATAARAGSVEFVDLLAQQPGLAVDTANRGGWTALSLSAQNGYTAVVARLLQAGANVNLATGTGETPLMTAIDAGHHATALVLLEAGADVNRSDMYGITALLVATRKGNVAMVRALLGAKAHVDQADKQKYTPLHVATFMGHTDIVETFLEARCNADAVCGSHRSTPLHLCSSGLAIRTAEIPKIFAACKSFPARTRPNCVAATKLLLMYGASLTALDGMGRTPAQAAGDDTRQLLVDEAARRQDNHGFKRCLEEDKYAQEEEPAAKERRLREEAEVDDDDDDDDDDEEEG